MVNLQMWQLACKKFKSLVPGPLKLTPSLICTSLSQPLAQRKTGTRLGPFATSHSKTDKLGHSKTDSNSGQY